MRKACRMLCRATGGPEPARKGSNQTPPDVPSKRSDDGARVWGGRKTNSAAGIQTARRSACEPLPSETTESGEAAALCGKSPFVTSTAGVPFYYRGFSRGKSFRYQPLDARDGQLATANFPRPESLERRKFEPHFATLASPGAAGASAPSSRPRSQTCFGPAQISAVAVSSG